MSSRFSRFLSCWFSTLLSCLLSCLFSRLFSWNSRWTHRWTSYRCSSWLFSRRFIRCSNCLNNNFLWTWFLCLWSCWNNWFIIIFVHSCIKNTATSLFLHLLLMSLSSSNLCDNYNYNKYNNKGYNSNNYIV